MSLRDALDDTGLTFADLACGVLVVIVLVFCLCCLGCAVYAVTTPADAESRSSFGVSFTHDGHLWFRAYGGLAVHHPDCRCQEANQ